MKELNKFGEVAGPKLNKDKTTLTWIGNEIDKWELLDHVLSWSDEPVKYLGMLISRDNEKAIQILWESKMEKMKKNNWITGETRNLKFFGRVVVVKTLAISLVIHLMMFEAVPKMYVKRMNKLCF